MSDQFEDYYKNMKKLFHVVVQNKYYEPNKPVDLSMKVKMRKMFEDSRISNGYEKTEDNEGNVILKKGDHTINLPSLKDESQKSEMNNLKPLKLVSFNIDIIYFESQQELEEYLNNDGEEGERHGNEDEVIFYEETGKEYNGELDEDLYDNDKYELNSKWSNYNVFKTFEESEKYRQEQLITPFINSFNN